MPEREPVEHHDQTPNPEEEIPSYYRAASFKEERQAASSYRACQELICEPEVELSAFRLQINRVWHVAILGPTEPPEEIAKKVEDILSAGEPVNLPVDILKMLLARRRQALSPGTTWVERHYRRYKPI